MRIALLALSLAAVGFAEDFDLLIRNARIIDGSGAPWFRGDVAVRGDSIAAVGFIPDASAAKTIDAADRALAPGFIDIHSHSNRFLFRFPAGENVVRQGVATIVEGNDGGSPLPLGEHLDKVRELRTAMNYASFVGHGSVRRRVVGTADRRASPEELERMRELVREAMRDGAFGLSTGLFYVPGVFAPTEEIIELAKVAAQFGGLHVSHIRDEADGLLDSVRETIRIGEAARLPTQITHHKAIGKANWGASRESLRLIDEARVRGVDVSLDLYPYAASHTGSTALFPAWALEGGREALLERLRAPATRARILDEAADAIERGRGGGDPANIQYSECDWDPTLNGKTLADAARRAGRPADVRGGAETAIEIEEKGGCRAVYHAMSEQDVERIMAHPGAMIASDGGVTAFGEGVPHPRNYGTFPRVLGRYVRETGTLRLEDAVRKMTLLPAQRLGLADRGLIRPGMKADLVVFDPRTVRDTADFGDPHRYPEGVFDVVVNGEVVLDDGAMTAARPGRVLLGPGAGR